ncbi:hypothetical protein TNCV_3047531 [Trichonephila clavipes]|nr:hypothetical protein TNCV_3047531 [Trichonephila clavipes]
MEYRRIKARTEVIRTVAVYLGYSDTGRVDSVERRSPSARTPQPSTVGVGVSMTYAATTWKHSRINQLPLHF